MTTPKGDVTYIYDGKNRLTQITDPVFGQFGFKYDPMDRRTELSYPNGIKTSYQYDRAYRLTAMVAKDGPGNVLDAWSYTYDRVGNRLSRTNKDGQAELYQYDPVYRLTRATYPNGVTEAFAYDPVGNRLSKTDGAGTTAYTYDVANQMLTAGGDTYTYDANGSVISKLTAGGALTTFTYDFQNRLTQITGPQGNERSQYAPDGTRVDIYGSTADAQYNPGEIGPQYDTIGNPILDMGNDRLVWVYRLYGPGIDEPLAEWRRINTQTTFLHKDALGSITAVSNPQGAVSYRMNYSAFGERNQTAPPGGIIPTRLSYTARETSVGSLMQYRSRFYETSAGRFLRQDSFRGDTSSPPGLHRYVYAFNNPVRYSDPTGMQPFPPTPIEPGSYTAAIFIISMVTAVVVLLALQCLFTGSAGGAKADCLLTLTQFLLINPTLVWIAAAAVFLGSILDIAEAWANGDIGLYEVFYLLFALVLSTALAGVLYSWVRAKTGPVEAGLATLWAWAFFNWFAGEIQRRSFPVRP
jgi:RHS repeat-associated protein